VELAVILRIRDTADLFKSSPASFEPQQDYYVDLISSKYHCRSIQIEIGRISTVIMILSGLEIVTRSLVRNLRNVVQQQQPCGVDLTLHQVSQWKSPATVDFDNTHRKGADTALIPFSSSVDSQSITLQPGAYLIDFNETVKIPLGLHGDSLSEIFTMALGRESQCWGC
jgi:hypothetical protein